MAGPDEESKKMDVEEEAPAREEEEAAAQQQEDQDDVVERIVREVVDGEKPASIPASPGTTASGKKKRLCRYPGCTRVIKSQGHCQRHGAKAKRCKVEGCEKQAQGTHDGMCKRHWKSINCPSPPPKPESMPPEPEGESVYDKILPASIAFRPMSNALLKAAKRAEEEKSSENGDEEEASASTSSKFSSDMPLVTFLHEGLSKAPGWHRVEERRARGQFPLASVSSQLEPWERQLAIFEVCLLSGGVEKANFSDLAHAWGREKGFHQLLVQAVCERRGEVERKKRSDYGKTLTQEERDAFRAKLKKARTSRSGSGSGSEAGVAIAGEEQAAGEQQQQQEAAAAAEPAEEELKPASVEADEVGEPASVSV